jgi:kinetochore protein Spc24
VLSQTLEQARAAAQRPASHPSSAQHEATITALEDEQLATAKSVNEETLAVARKEAELKRLKDELAELEAWDVGKDAEQVLGGEVWVLFLVIYGLQSCAND